jgi:hypothetical protein
MPFVQGYLEIITSNQPSNELPSGGGRPSNELPGRNRPTDPGYGQEVGGLPSNDLPPVPGINPPISISNPIVPLPPQASNKPVPPTGSIWPPLHGPGAGKDKFLVLVLVPGVGYRYTVVDPSLEIGLPLPSDPAHASGQPVPGGEHPSGQPVPPQPQPTPRNR